MVAKHSKSFGMEQLKSMEFTMVLKEMVEVIVVVMEEEVMEEKEVILLMVVMVIGVERQLRQLLVKFWLLEAPGGGEVLAAYGFIR